eukprot:8537743-Pyramimonas_sp.AAC.1
MTHYTLSSPALDGGLRALGPRITGRRLIRRPQARREPPDPTAAPGVRRMCRGHGAGTLRGLAPLGSAEAA